MTIVKLKQPKYLLSFKNYTQRERDRQTKSVRRLCVQWKWPLKWIKEEKKRNSFT